MQKSLQPEPIAPPPVPAAAAAPPVPAAAATLPTAAVRARSARLWEIDALRGTAVITMIIYHLGWDLASFGLAAIQPYDGIWYLLQRYTCITFITLAGLSLTLVDRRLERKGVERRARFVHFVKRGLWIFFWGMTVTAAMWFVGFRVDFGVLHLIGFASIAAFPFLRRPWAALAGWALLFTLGAFTPNWNVDHRWLVWLGLYPADYYAVDYFPLIPWFGVALLGVFLGNRLYPNGERLFALPDYGDATPARGLRWLGSHSLWIYLLHQPLLFGLLTLYFYLRF